VGATVRGFIALKHRSEDQSIQIPPYIPLHEFNLKFSGLRTIIFSARWRFWPLIEISRDKERKVKKIATLSVAAVTLLAGCLVMVPSISESGSPPAGAKSPTFGPFTNNSVVRLEPGIYREDLEVRANKVSFVGSGAGITVLQGSVTIYGNSCVFRDLTISGNVLILGNNNDLSAAAVKGGIRSQGNNNLW
jgi:hypothetical protein